MTLAQMETMQELKNIIFDYCRDEMCGRGCKGCILEKSNVCVADFPSIKALRKAIALIEKERNSRK